MGPPREPATVSVESQTVKQPGIAMQVELNGEFRTSPEIGRTSSIPSTQKSPSLPLRVISQVEAARKATTRKASTRSQSVLRFCVARVSTGFPVISPATATTLKNVNRRGNAVGEFRSKRGTGGDESERFKFRGGRRGDAIPQCLAGPANKRSASSANAM